MLHYLNIIYVNTIVNIIHVLFLLYVNTMFIFTSFGSAKIPFIET